MGTNLKLNVLQSIGDVFEKAKDSKLTDAFFKEIDTDLQSLSNFFSVDKLESFFLSQIFALNFNSSSVDYGDLIGHFNCNPMKLLSYNECFSNLLSRSYIKTYKSRHPFKVASSGEQFVVNQEIIQAVLNNKVVSKIGKENPKTDLEILEEIYDLIYQRDRKDITTFELFVKVENYVNENIGFPLMKKVKRLNLESENTYLYLFLIWKTITGFETISLNRTLEGIYERELERYKFLLSFKESQNELIKNGLVEMQGTNFFSDVELRLTSKSVKIIKDAGIKLFLSEKKKNNIIEPSEISSKKLFFNEDENKQLSMLYELLQKSKLKKIKHKLKNKNLPQGITVLLHGLPGTGKTETVYQIAKKTKRGIIKVDISQSKSMWFGESEKIIKRIFTDYKDYAKECKVKPILLFNEADAIISKRKDVASSNVAQVENTIQNIILEELEHFEGLFFATTNLVANFDSAFDRRFLFKIEFKKTEIPIKAKIWKSKLPKLTKANCNLLAKRFEFSGGQIDNIVRKSEMYEVIKDETFTLDKIIKFCEAEELLKTNKYKLGFMPSNN